MEFLFFLFNYFFDKIETTAPIYKVNLYLLSFHPQLSEGVT